MLFRSSRAAENLFWLGRYTERTENTTRLARLIIETLNGESPTPPELLHWLDATARVNSLVLSSVPALAQSRRVFERSLAASLGDVQWSASVGFNLRALRQAAASVRDRLSLQQWNLIHDAHEAFLAQHAHLMAQPEPSPAQLTWLLDQLAQRT